MTRVDAYDIIPEEFFCPRCKSKLMEKRPEKDKKLIVNKQKVVRLFCSCGYYQDEYILHDKSDG